MKFMGLSGITGPGRSRSCACRRQYRGVAGGRASGNREPGTFVFTAGRSSADTIARGDRKIVSACCCPTAEHDRSRASGEFFRNSRKAKAATCPLFWNYTHRRRARYWTRDWRRRWRHSLNRCRLECGSWWWSL